MYKCVRSLRLSWYHGQESRWVGTHGAVLFVAVVSQEDTGRGLTMLILIYSVFGIFWKCARVGERLSPYVSLCCVAMAVSG